MDELSKTLVVPCQHGLHMRVAARIVSLAVGFDADTFFASGSRTASAKSIIALMELGAIRGELVVISARGKDAAKALQAMTALFDEEAGHCRADLNEDPDE